MSKKRISLGMLNVIALFYENPNKEYYGQQIIKELGISGGSLYPILSKLEEHKWLESEFEDPREVARRPRCYYKLTPKGKIEVKKDLSKYKFIKFADSREGQG